MPTTDTKDRKPAYIAFKTFLTAIETFEQGIPPIIERSVWHTFSGGLQTHTLNAFKFLGLVDEKGAPQPILQKVVHATGEERKAILKEIIDNKYREALQLGRNNASFQQLQDHFRASGITGGTLEMAVRFFLDACNYTGEKPSPFWAKAKKTMRRTRKAEASKTNEHPPAAQETPPPAGRPSKPSAGLHPMLEGLIKELPEPGTELNTQKREALKKYFDIILDIMYVNK
jgi:hypothetical protein